MKNFILCVYEEKAYRIKYSASQEMLMGEVTQERLHQNYFFIDANETHLGFHKKDKFLSWPNL